MLVIILFIILFLLVVGPIAYTFIAEYMLDRKILKEFQKEHPPYKANLYENYIKKCKDYFEK